MLILLRLFLILFIYITIMPMQTQAEIKVPSGYKVETFASGMVGPSNVEFNDKDELFVAESGKKRILKITPHGTVTVFAKSAQGYPLDFWYSYWTTPSYPFPTKMNFDTNGYLYVEVPGDYNDPYNPYGDVLDTLYRISPNGVVERIARQWLGQNVFYDIAGLTFRPDGYLYMGDTAAHDILRVDTVTKTSTVFASNIFSPYDLLFDNQGNLYAAMAATSTDKLNLYRFAPDGTRTLYTDAISCPIAIDWGPEGYLYILDHTTSSIYTLDPQTKVINTFATGFNYPWDIGFDSRGNLYVVEARLGEIIKISKEEVPFSNVRLIDTIPNKDVEFVLSSAIKIPYRVTTEDDKTIVEWRFDSFNIGQNESISFDLNLYNLIPGENRLVDHKLELIYTDKNGKETIVALPELYIHVLNSAFNSILSTDKPVYQANVDVATSVQITNLSEYAKVIDAKILIEDSQGILVKEVTTLSNLNFNAGETKDFSNLIFNTGTTYAGDYRAHLILYENQKQVGEALTNFKIQPTIAITSKVTTDKIAYKANEPVTITSTIQSLSPNYIFKNLTAKITISRQNTVDSIQVDTKTIPILTPGQLTELKTYWNTSTNPKGTYTVKLEVMEGLSVLSTSVASFEILSSSETGEGLIGTITAQPNPVYQGRDETITYTITNKGNEDIANLNVKVIIVDPETQAIKTEYSRQYTVGRGETITEVNTVSTATLTPKTYLVILQAVTPTMSEPKTLASTTFEVKPALEITKTIPDIKNVLVWLNYPWQSGQNTPDRSLIERALNEAGVSYHIVLDKKEFETELRNPYYTDFMILGDHNPIEDHFSEELREQVYSGKGLISSMFNRQNLDEDLFGIKFTGHLSGSDYPVELLESEISAQGNFQSYGRALKVEAKGEAENIPGWIVETTKKGINKYPGIIKRQYGNGKILFFAFDLGLSSTNYDHFASLLKNSLNNIHNPLDTTAFSPNQLVPVEITVKSLGGAFDLRMTETYPEELKLYDPSTGQWTAENPWIINMHLEPDETKTILYYALTPDKAGTYTLQTEVGYMDNGNYNFYQSLSTDITIIKNTATMTNDILYSLNALTVSGQDRAKVENVKRYIMNVQQRVIATKNDVDMNIHDLLQAIDSLLSVTSADITGIRLMMEGLLRTWEGRYYYFL